MSTCGRYSIMQHVGRITDVCWEVGNTKRESFFQACGLFERNTYQVIAYGPAFFCHKTAVKMNNA